MTLPFELTTLPHQALDILRFMGHNQLDQADAYDLIDGTGLTERSFSKGIKRLVTKNYMMMDEARVYHLTQKGYKAIEDLQTHDETAPPAPRTPTPDYDTLAYDLCVVMLQTVQSGAATPLMLGLEPVDGQPPLEDEVQLIVRLDVVNGTAEPHEFSAQLSPDIPVVMAEFNLTPAPDSRALRLRVEAFQSLRMDQLEEAGGMFFDIVLDEPVTRPQAMHAVLDVLQ